jgi:hypothetical protein
MGDGDYATAEKKLLQAIASLPMVDSSKGGASLASKHDALRELLADVRRAKSDAARVANTYVAKITKPTFNEPST